MRAPSWLALGLSRVARPRRAASHADDTAAAGDGDGGGTDAVGNSAGVREAEGRVENTRDGNERSTGAGLGARTLPFRDLELQDRGRGSQQEANRGEESDGGDGGREGEGSEGAGGEGEGETGSRGEPLPTDGRAMVMASSSFRRNAMRALTAFAYAVPVTLGRRQSPTAFATDAETSGTAIGVQNGIELGRGREGRGEEEDEGNEDGGGVGDRDDIEAQPAMLVPADGVRPSLDGLDALDALDSLDSPGSRISDGLYRGTAFLSLAGGLLALYTRKGIRLLAQAIPCFTSPAMPTDDPTFQQLLMVSGIFCGPIMFSIGGLSFCVIPTGHKLSQLWALWNGLLAVLSVTYIFLNAASLDTAAFRRAQFQILEPDAMLPPLQPARSTIYLHNDVRSDPQIQIQTQKKDPVVWSSGGNELKWSGANAFQPFQMDAIGNVIMDVSTTSHQPLDLLMLRMGSGSEDAATNPKTDAKEPYSVWGAEAAAVGGKIAWVTKFALPASDVVGVEYLPTLVGSKRLCRLSNDLALSCAADTNNTDSGVGGNSSAGGLLLAGASHLGSHGNDSTLVDVPSDQLRPATQPTASYTDGRSLSAGIEVSLSLKCRSKAVEAGGRDGIEIPAWRMRVKTAQGGKGGRTNVEEKTKNQGGRNRPDTYGIEDMKFFVENFKLTVPETEQIPQIECSPKLDITGEKGDLIFKSMSAVPLHH